MDTEYNCECPYHRYHCVHCLPGSNKVFDHSQGTWDSDLRGKEGIQTYPIRFYRHGMTADELRKAYEEGTRTYTKEDAFKRVLEARLGSLAPGRLSMEYLITLRDQVLCWYGEIYALIFRGICEVCGTGLQGGYCRVCGADSSYEDELREEADEKAMRREEGW